MIAVKLQARLGNQLFQYAFARAASSILGCGFYLDREQNEFYPGKYFDLPGAALRWWEVPFFVPVSVSSGATLAMRQWFYPRLRRTLLRHTVEVDDVAPDLGLLSKLSDWTFYSGYFQSEQFFQPLSDALRSELKPKKVLRSHWLPHRQKYREGGRRICAVHVRGGDYENWNLSALGGGDMRLGKSYYDGALAPFLDNSSWRIFVVTDDTRRAREVIVRSERVTFSTGSEIEDLMLLADADAVVMSNSSFAWWGAWMGERPDRMVIAPKHFNGFKLGCEIPRGILPERWRRQEVVA